MNRHTHSLRLVATKIVLAIFMLSTLVPTTVHATGTTPSVFVYQGRLLDNTGAPITVAHSFRFSFWKSADWVSGDATGGSINTGATNYGGWNEVQTVTPNSDGVFSVQLGSSTALPTIDFVLHKYVQVEVKTVVGADTTYQNIDPTGDAGADTNDRMVLGSLPYAKNTESVENRAIGTASGNILLLGSGGKISVAQMANGTNAQLFTLNAGLTAGDVTLSFGSSILSQALKFSATNNRFEFSKDLFVTGALSATGTLSGSALNVNTTSTFGGIATHNANVKVRGNLSGSTLTADQLRNCDTINTDANGNLSCGTDADTQFSNTGSLKTFFDAKYISKQGDSMTGALTIKNSAGLNASGSLLTNSDITLNSDNSASDAVLTFGNSVLAQTLTFSSVGQRFVLSKDLYITGSLGTSGTLSGLALNVNTTSTFGGVATHNASVKVRGNLSGSTLTVDQLRNCNTIDTDANGNLVCGTDASGGASGTGTAIEDADRNTKVTTTPNDTIKMIVAGKDRLTISGTYLTLSGNTIPVEGSAFTSLTRTFTTPESTGNVGSYSSMKIGTDNLPVVAYYDATNQDLKVTKCGNATCTSGNTTTTVDSTGSVGTYASLAIGTDGFPVIAYADNTNSDLKVAKCTNADCSASTITSVDTAGSVGSSTSIAIGTDSFPVISYLDSTSENLKVAKCGNASCSSGNTITTVESTNDVGYYTQIAIGADGFPIIAHLQFTAADLRVLKCGNAACTSGNSAYAVDTGSISNNGFGLAIGTDSYPVITYNESSTLKVAKCSTADCSSSTLSTVDGTSGISQFKSMTIGTDGFPIIAYGRTSAGDFYIAKCGNAACSSGNTLTSVDATNDVGNHSSIVIAASGYPIASYYDSTSEDLKLVSCVNATCAATTGGSYTAGSGHDAGSPGNFFRNIYTSAIKLKTPSGFLTFTGVGDPSLDVAAVHDTDNNTKIQAEENTDEDILRFDTAGKERVTIGATGVSTFSGSVAIKNGNGLNASGSLLTNSNITLNSDNGAVNAVLTFGNAALAQTLTFSHANQRFEFTKGIYVNGVSTLSGATTIMNTAGENNLILSGRGGTEEGGQIVFMPALNRPYSFMWDNYQNTTRLLRGDTSGTSVATLMTMTSSGSLGIGTSPSYKFDVTDSRSSDYVARFVNTANTAGAQGIIVQAGSNSQNNSYIVRFLRPDSTEIGKIVQDSTTSVAYMTTSDRRTKNDLGMDVPGLDAVMKLQVHRYSFKNDVTGEEHIGFFAQDLAEVFPEAVYKGDDGQQVREPWSVDYSRLTPLLVKSVQELQQEILRQNNEIDELKSRLDIIETILK